MSLEGQPRRRLAATEGIIDCAVLLAHCELCPDFEIFVLWQILRSPSREAVWIPIVTSLWRILSPI